MQGIPWLVHRPATSVTAVSADILEIEIEIEIVSIYL
jgi:hypothetical protein